MSRLSLDEILALEEHEGLLDVKAQQQGENTDKSRLEYDFEELNSFIDAHGREPGVTENPSKIPVKERMLSMRLKSYRENPSILSQVAQFDRHNLLSAQCKEYAPESLDEILELDDELLNTASDEIFELKHARSRAARPDRISERRQAKDFEQFKPLFDSCIADLVSGKRISIRFANEQEINAGEFFILNGVMVYVAEVNDPHIRSGKRNARLRLIFENGTEGENLARALASALYKDPAGRRITNPEPGILFGSESRFETKLSPDDKITGCIYVVKSLSTSPEILRYEGRLFKIGFTTGKFDDRVRGAKDDPTFLLAPVHPLRTYDAVGINTSKFENLLHRFFAPARLDIEILDRFGKPFKPKEWYLVPLPIVEKAISMLLDGSIIRYQYDPQTESIIPYQG